MSGLGPLTSRSVTSLLLLLYLLLGPIKDSADIVSASLAYALLVIILLVTFAVVTHGILLKRNLSVSIRPPEQVAHSGELVRIILALKGARILPFLVLDIMIEFEHSGATPAVIRISGFSKKERAVFLDIQFPHRGSWDIRGARCTLRDVTGLTRYQWFITQQTAVTIAPPPVHDCHLPVLSSTQRPGEMVVDIFNRQGEPFDIKTYHPSDGMKKIVWKAFAKRGELLSRHPEASMTPEGYVVLFVIAGTEGDKVCAQAVAYTESLARLKLDIIAGCEGVNGRTPMHSPEDLKELLIDSVWDTNPSSQRHLERDVASLLDYCSQLTPGIVVNKLLLFTTAERISNPEEAAQVQQLAGWLSSQRITPIFCLTPPTIAATPSTSPKIAMIRHLLITPEHAPSDATSGSSYNSFLSSCLHNQWEVHI